MRKTTIIATVDCNLGLSRTGCVPWSIGENTDFFNSKINGNIVVMSRRQWIFNGRIKNCINFILSEHAIKAGDFSGGLQDLKAVIDKTRKDVFIIGGREIFKIYGDVADEIILTKIKMNYACDEFFPKINENYEIVSCQSEMFSTQENCFYSRIHYKNNGGLLHQEYKYLDLLEDVVENDGFSCNKSITFSCVGKSKIPMMTTDRVNYERVFSKVFLALNGNGNTGFQWRFFGAKHSKLFETQILLDKKEVLGGIDQIELLEQNFLNLRERGNNLVLTSLNPLSENSGGGVVCQFIVQEDRYLSMIVNITSMDALKIKDTIVFYSLMLYIFAAKTSRLATEITFNFGTITCGLASIKKLKEIAKKSPAPFPILKIYDYVKHKKIQDLNALDFVVCGY